jgi:hypothetical protein
MSRLRVSLPLPVPIASGDPDGGLFRAAKKNGLLGWNRAARTLFDAFKDRAVPRRASTIGAR